MHKHFIEESVAQHTFLEHAQHLGNMRWLTVPFDRRPDIMRVEGELESYMPKVAACGNNMSLVVCGMHGSCLLCCSLLDI